MANIFYSCISYLCNSAASVMIAIGEYIKESGQIIWEGCRSPRFEKLGRGIMEVGNTLNESLLPAEAVGILYPALRGKPETDEEKKLLGWLQIGLTALNITLLLTRHWLNKEEHKIIRELEQSTTDTLARTTSTACPTLVAPPSDNQVNIFCARPRQNIYEIVIKAAEALFGFNGFLDFTTSIAYNIFSIPNASRKMFETINAFSLISLSAISLIYHVACKHPKPELATKETRFEPRLLASQQNFSGEHGMEEEFAGTIPGNSETRGLDSFKNGDTLALLAEEGSVGLEQRNRNSQNLNENAIYLKGLDKKDCFAGLIYFSRRFGLTMGLFAVLQSQLRKSRWVNIFSESTPSAIYMGLSIVLSAGYSFIEAKHDVRKERVSKAFVDYIEGNSQLATTSSSAGSYILARIQEGCANLSIRIQTGWRSLFSSELTARPEDYRPLPDRLEAPPRSQSNLQKLSAIHKDKFKLEWLLAKWCIFIFTGGALYGPAKYLKFQGLPLKATLFFPAVISFALEGLFAKRRGYAFDTQIIPEKKYALATQFEKKVVNRAERERACLCFCRCLRDNSHSPEATEDRRHYHSLE